PPTLPASLHDALPIWDLRQLGFSMSQIKAYLDHQSVDNTLSMLRQEETLLQERLAETQRRIRRLRQRVSDLHAARSIEAGHYQIDRKSTRLNSSHVSI